MSIKECCRIHRDPLSDTGQLLKEQDESLEEILTEENASKISSVVLTPTTRGHRFFNISLGSECGSICRICHEGEGKERLISPCKCRGTMGLIHRTCMETWLGLAGVTRCELCGYQLTLRTEPKEFLEWLQDPASPHDRKNIKADAVCFMMLTPLACISSWLCITGAMHYITDEDHSQWEGVGLVLLAVFLLLIYLLWCMIAVKYHYHIWQEWRATNRNVFLELSNLISTSTQDENNNNAQTNTASLSSGEQDGSHLSELSQCSGGMVLSSTPRFTRLPNQPGHICYCSYAHQTLCHQSDAGNACNINFLPSLSTCNSNHSHRTSSNAQQDRIRHDHADAGASIALFKNRDLVDADTRDTELGDRGEVSASGSHRWVIHSPRSPNDSSSTNKSVTFNVQEDERLCNVCLTRSSTPTKDDANRSNGSRRTRYFFSEKQSANNVPSCTDALLLTEESDDIV